jgi:hypothetical protein
MAINDPITSADGWFSGEDKTFNWTIYQADAVTPQNITGYTFHWELRLNRDASMLLGKDSGSGIAIVSPTAGTLTVTIARADTLALEPGMYYHELARTNSGSYTVETYGAATLQRGVRP